VSLGKFACCHSSSQSCCCPAIVARSTPDRESSRHYRVQETGDVPRHNQGAGFVVFKSEETSKVRKALLLETADVAVELGLSPRTLEGWRRRGEGPPYLKVGRLVKYRPEDIEAYKAAQLRANLPLPGKLQT
jgi:Helix-turn-helix domain